MYPEPEITTVPLRDNLSSITSIQDMEWIEQATRRTLPRVPTLDDRPQAGDDGRTRTGYRTGPGGYPNSAYPNSAYPNSGGSNQGYPRGMPQSPTDAGPSPSGGGYPRPASIGQGNGYGPTSAPGGGYQPNAPRSNSPNYSSPVSNHVNGNYSYNGAAPAVQQPPTASNYTANNNVASIENHDMALASPSPYASGRSNGDWRQQAL